MAKSPIEVGRTLLDCDKLSCLNINKTDPAGMGLVQMPPVNSFRLLKRDIARRLQRPLFSFTFWTFLVLGIIVYGGLAIWIEIGKYLNADHPSIEGIRLSLLTYFPAVGCAAGQQISVYEESRSYMRQFGNIVSVSFLLLCVIGYWLQDKHPVLSLVVSIISSLAAVVVAWIAIGMDKPFDETDPDAAVGGDPDTPLSGTTGGYAL